MSSYANSQIYFLVKYLFNGLPAHTNPGLSDRSDPIWFSASSADSVQVACSTLPLKLNLRFSLSQRLTLPSVSTPCSRSPSGSFPRSSTVSVGLSARKALLSSLAISVLAPLSLPFHKLGLKVIRLVQIKLFDRIYCL